ncbi:MAG: ATP synthase F1 subunit gamma, partial [Calditrichia bacterium]
VLLVVVTADRGLAGAFNGNIIKRTILRMQELENQDITLLCIGRKGYDFFRKRQFSIEKHYINFFNNLDFSNAQEITGFLVSQYREKNFDLIEVIYNQFKNAAQQNVIVEQYLPIIPAKFEGSQATIDYIYEPDKEVILKSLLPRHLNIQTWRILLESNAAEQGARMTAMENATENAAEMIHDLTLSYNRARQSAITKEISEIVGGAEALKSA